jgi:hypothetical protein
LFDFSLCGTYSTVGRLYAIISIEWWLGYSSIQLNFLPRNGKFALAEETSGYHNRFDQLDRINRAYFSVLIRAIDRDDYMRKLGQLSNMSDIERTITQVVARVVKEDPRVDTSA